MISPNVVPGATRPLMLGPPLDRARATSVTASAVSLVISSKAPAAISFGATSQLPAQHANTQVSRR